MNYFFCFFLVLSYSISFAQKRADSTADKLFTTAIEYYNNKNLDSAVAIWTRIADNRIGVESNIYGNSLFNIGIAYLQKKEYENAKNLYKRILVSEVRDNDETGQLMEPHTNYKHKAALSLARLYYQDSNFLEALHWVNKADTVYRYWGFEGSATNVSKKQASLLSWKVHLLKMLNQTEQAIYEIISELLCSGNLESFFSEEQAELLSLIDKPGFKAEFDKAIENLQINKIDNNNFVASFTVRGAHYEIPIQKGASSRDIPHYWKILFMKQDDIITKEAIIQYIKKRDFYKQL